MDENILTPIERKGLIEEKRQLERHLKESEEGWGKGGPGSQLDKGLLQRQIKHIDNVLGKQTEILKSVDKDRVYREVKQLEEEVKEGMPSQEEYYHPRGNTIMKHVMWEKRNREKIQRLKQLYRRLEPDDPTISNIEKLRRLR